MVQTQEHASRVERVVVGVDGSEPSKAALRWAARYAACAGLPLHVLLAWHVPADYGWSLPLPGDWHPEEDARDVLAREVSEVLGTVEDVSVTWSTIEGPAAQVLVDESARASAVVVASRGHGQIRGMLLGSVSSHLATHAHCPVVVVRDEGAPTAADDAGREPTLVHQSGRPEGRGAR